MRLLLGQLKQNISLSRSTCVNYLHRLGFVLKRPKKRLVKADEAKRESFLAEYAVLWDEARRSGAKIFFADEAHFRADAELRASGCCVESRPWWTRAARAMARRPATTRQCAWRRARLDGAEQICTKNRNKKHFSCEAFPAQPFVQSYTRGWTQLRFPFPPLDLGRGTGHSSSLSLSTTV